MQFRLDSLEDHSVLSILKDRDKTRHKMFLCIIKIVPVFFNFDFGRKDLDTA